MKKKILQVAALASFVLVGLSGSYGYCVKATTNNDKDANSEYYSAASGVGGTAGRGTVAPTVPSVPGGSPAPGVPGATAVPGGTDMSVGKDISSGGGNVGTPSTLGMPSEGNPNLGSPAEDAKHRY